LRLFHWLCGTEIPPGYDLRRRGWRLTEAGHHAGGVVALAHITRMDRHGWTRLRDAFPRPRHDRVLLLGVGKSAERARLLALGFGDVLGNEAALAEVDARAARIIDRAGMIPGSRAIGALRLDLEMRDGFVAGRKLALHPREFALLWRLADKPGVAATKEALLREVWRLSHVPETNSLAVHVFRLRAKLAAAGVDGLVRTAPEGGYMLAPPIDSAKVPAIPLLTADSRMDDLLAIDADAGVAIGDLSP
jgi:two-component system, OmpR family, response regulator